MTFLLCLALSAGVPERPTSVIIVVGAPGTDEYGKQFADWSTNIERAASSARAAVQMVGRTAPSHDRDLLQSLLAKEAGESAAEFWLILIGHGTFDGRNARFNLRGADVTGDELAEWLAPIRRPTAVVACSSSSGALLSLLSAPNRVVVTATKNGHEQNFSRFGGQFSKSIADQAADLDKDGQVSLLEAFLSASSRVEEYYKTEALLATEHALLDDTGDKLGSSADWFQGVHAIKRAKDGAKVDGLRAHQFHLVRSAQERRIPASLRVERDRLELAIAELRDAKTNQAEDEYYQKLETLLVEFAKLHERIDASTKSGH